MVLLPQFGKEHPLSSPPTLQNQLLARLPENDLDRLAPHLEPVPMPIRMVLEAANEPITHVYFPSSAVTSVVAGAGEDSIEVGLIGRDGMTGVNVVLGADTTPHQCFVQIAGDGHRLAVAELRSAFDAEPGLRKHFLLYARSFMLQTAHTAFANGRCTIEERLARWLLLSRDRLDSDDILLTHEFLSLMLGVRRPGVTIALQSLEAANLIRNTRGCVTIRDRPKLEEIAGHAYSASASHQLCAPMPS
jgi:CRP-like cAMP-binding protein